MAWEVESLWGRTRTVRGARRRDASRGRAARRSRRRSDSRRRAGRFLSRPRRSNLRSVHPLARLVYRLVRIHPRRVSPIRERPDDRPPSERLRNRRRCGSCTACSRRAATRHTSETGREERHRHGILMPDRATFRIRCPKRSTSAVQRSRLVAPKAERAAGAKQRSSRGRFQVSEGKHPPPHAAASMTARSDHDWLAKLLQSAKCPTFGHGNALLAEAPRRITERAGRVLATASVDEDLGQDHVRVPTRLG
jgi:hypothetical protein